jgi:hypothetical protein
MLSFGSWGGTTPKIAQKAAPPVITVTKNRSCGGRLVGKRNSASLLPPTLPPNYLVQGGTAMADYCIDCVDKPDRDSPPNSTPGWRANLPGSTIIAGSSMVAGGTG